MGYSGAGGKLFNEKNQEQKISWHCPIKPLLADFHLFQSIGLKNSSYLMKNHHIVHFLLQNAQQ